MNNQKLLLSVIGLIAIFAIGYLVVSSKNRDNNIINEPVVENPGDEVVGENPVTPIDNPSSGLKAFGGQVQMMEKESVTFSDGLRVVLMEINDSRCKPGLQCFWQGELSGTFRISGGKLTGGEKEVILGTERNKQAVLNDYTFTLVSATPEAITYTVVYKKTATGGPCYVGGCGGQICSDQEGMVSTCEYKEEYACYKTAKCERQPSGQCGWTPTQALQACLGVN